MALTMQSWKTFDEKLFESKAKYDILGDTNTDTEYSLVLKNTCSLFYLTTGKNSAEI